MTHYTLTSKEVCNNSFKTINGVYIVNVIQMLTGVEGNINYISASERRNIARNEGQYIRPKWANMINAAKNSQRLFCCMKPPSPYTKSRKGLKTNRRNFLSPISRIHEFIIMPRPFPKYIRHQTVSGIFCCPLKLCYICFTYLYSSINHKSL